MPAIAPAPKNPILWRDFCVASRANAPRAAFFGSRRRFSRPGGGRGASGLPAGAPGDGPACRGTKFKTMHVALENVTAGRSGFAPPLHCRLQEMFANL